MDKNISAQLAAFLRSYDEDETPSFSSDNLFTLADSVGQLAVNPCNVKNIPSNGYSEEWEIKTLGDEGSNELSLVEYRNGHGQVHHTGRPIPAELQMVDFAPDGYCVGGNQKYVPQPNELENALSLNQITLLYQPTVDLATGRIVELEAIPYWHHFTYGLVPLTDVEYSSKAEFIESLARWGFATATANMVKWQAAYSSYVELELSATICGPLLEVSSLLNDLSKQMDCGGLKPRYFSAQLNSDQFLLSQNNGANLADALRSAGFKIALNEFDGGIDALAAIKNHPVRTLRLSKEFTAKVGRMQVDPSLSRTVIGLAKSMNLRVVATGVETARQLKRLRSFGCDIAQGSIFAAPLSAEELEPLLSQRAVFFHLVDSVNDLPGGF